MKMDKSLSIMLEMREKIRVEEPKYFHFGHVYISGPLASSVKSTAVYIKDPFCRSVDDRGYV